jgi:uncharacterized protein YbaR (Trm112 family)
MEKVVLNKTLLEILRCPDCVHDKGGLLRVYKDCWLVCLDCEKKYPVVDSIPVMLIEEGEKWVKVPESELPIPPLSIK